MSVDDPNVPPLVDTASPPSPAVPPAAPDVPPTPTPPAPPPAWGEPAADPAAPPAAPSTPIESAPSPSVFRVDHAKLGTAYGEIMRGVDIIFAALRDLVA